MNSLINISDISRNYYHYLFTYSNVRGVGVGYKIINGIETDELCIHVFVDKKINSPYLTSSNIIPSRYMGVSTDVIELGTPKILGSNSPITERYRPLKGGCGIYTKNATLSGTLGCIVVKKRILGDKYFILSNNHVLADENSIPLGTEVIQPTPSDGGTFKNDVVAKLSDFIEIKFPHGISKPKNFVDCALAELSSKSLTSKEILKIGKVTGSSNPVLRDHVKKTGVKSGLSDGKIISVNTTMEVDFGSNSKVLFANQIMALLPSVHGDSGSVVLNDNNQVVGLLFATGNLGVSIINDINLVLKALKVEIYK